MSKFKIGDKVKIVDFYDNLRLVRLVLLMTLSMAIITASTIATTTYKILVWNCMNNKKLI